MANKQIYEFLSYYPLKQGLKPESGNIFLPTGGDFYPTIH